MEKMIFEKRAANEHEKACKAVYDPESGKVYGARYKGTEEAEKRLPKLVWPRVFVTKRSGYVPVKYRNDDYIIL